MKRYVDIRAVAEDVVEAAPEAAFKKLRDRRAWFRRAPCPWSSIRVTFALPVSLSDRHVGLESKCTPSLKRSTSDPRHPLLLVQSHLPLVEAATFSRSAQS